MSKHRAPMERMAIEKGLPLPPIGLYGPVLRKMVVGDSFLVGNRDIQSRVLTWAKRLGIAVTTRKVNGEGFRVWRVRRKA